MLTDEAASQFRTHEVFNQPEPLINYNPFESDAVLQEGLEREGAEWAVEDVRAFGDLVGSEHVIELGRLANEHTPQLKSHDRVGNRLDQVEFHPAYHELLTIGMRAEIHALAWNDSRPGAHVARAAKHILLSQAEAGVGCPLTMTFAVVPALRHQPEVAAEWIPRVTSKEYDPRFIPASQKKGAMMGMAMTEKQGGSDVRSNTTEARPIGGGGPGAEYELTGHKWFCSAPMSDAFLSLAKTENGLSCFLVPRWLPDGTQNRILIQRLKDKVGNRSNASSEIEFNGTWAVMVGEEGRGIATIIEMVAHTRLDCSLGASAIMRQGVAQATHFVQYRSAFGKKLRDQPLMKNVLADLAIESEAATTFALRIARSFDEAQLDDEQQYFQRIATPVCKYWLTKRSPQHAFECMESTGANGYVEESIMARLYKEAPVNSVWEGSGNVICLDVLRAMGREPETVAAFIGEVEKAKGSDARLDESISNLKNRFAGDRDFEAGARRLVEEMALTLQGSLLVRHGHPAVADAFCASRLAGNHGAEYGTLPASTAVDEIIDRATPKLS